MEEENAMTMNLDLNLTPVDSSSTNNDLASGSEPIALMNLEEWLQDPNRRIREAVMYRNQRWRSFWRQLPIPQETRNLAMGLIAGNEIQTGHVEPVESHRNEVAKVHENSNGPLKDETLDKKKDAEKDNSDEGNYFDCSICLDLAKEPVVTCCGHLFCWPCIYRWLHLHSEAKECPVCKGEVTTKKVTPIYGRGFNTRKPDSETMKIPLRPQAQRIESWRQSVQRTAFTIPMEEMIRRLGATFDFSRDLQVPSLHPNAPPNESPDITNSLLNRLMTNRGLRGDTTPIITSNERIDSTDFNTRNFETRASDHRFSPSLLQRSNAHHLANNASAINISSDELLAADMSLESYLNNNPLFERYQDLTLPYNDRNSVSSIAAGIHSESPAIDNAVEINSTLAQHSASSSRRRNDSSSRVSDVSGGDYRPSNRRRLY